MCQGKKLKEAGLLGLSMCRTGTTRWSSVGPCRLWKTSLGGLTCVACSCGAVYMWVYGGAVTVPSSYSTSWMELIDSDMESARRGVFTCVLLPLPKDTATVTPSVPRQLLNYAHVAGVLLTEAVHLVDSIAHERVDLEQTLNMERCFPANSRPWG